MPRSSSEEQEALIAALQRRLEDVPIHEPVSVRQVVAFNLARGRRTRGLSQQGLGELLSVVTGRYWSRATVSAAESGWEGGSGRVRHFDVDEVVAFSATLDLPIPWFFAPPGLSPTRERVDDEDYWITPTKTAVGPWFLLTSPAFAQMMRPTTQHDVDKESLFGYIARSSPKVAKAKGDGDELRINILELTASLQELLQKQDRDEER